MKSACDDQAECIDRVVRRWLWGLWAVSMFAHAGCQANVERPPSVALPPQPVAVRELQGPPPPEPTEEELAAAKKEAARRKVLECNQVIELINRGIEALNASDLSPAGLEAMAGVMDGVAHDIGELKLTDAELRRLRDVYGQTAKDMARRGREVAAAADANDIEKEEQATAALERAASQEDPLVDAINEFCGGAQALRR